MYFWTRAILQSKEKGELMLSWNMTFIYKEFVHLSESFLFYRFFCLFIFFLYKSFKYKFFCNRCSENSLCLRQFWRVIVYYCVTVSYVTHTVKVGTHLRTSGSTDKIKLSLKMVRGLSGGLNNVNFSRLNRLPIVRVPSGSQVGTHLKLFYQKF